MKKRMLLVFLFVLFGCTSIDTQENVTFPNETQEALYGQAITELHTEASSDLEDRYTRLEALITEGEEQLSIAQFTRIKIELDFLEIAEYDATKVDALRTLFVASFSEARKTAGANPITGSSLNDRYFAVTRELESLSASDELLQVVDYLRVEQGLQQLEADGYLITRLEETKADLFTLVLGQLELGIVSYEPTLSEVEEVSIEEPEEVVEEVPEEQIIPEGPRTRKIHLIDGGFSSSALTIRVNDTVLWKNVREGRYNMALVLGNRECRDVKSSLFYLGDSYNFTFTEPMKCWVSDGIYTTQAMEITVS
jgi:hypothetical protein